MRLTKKESRGHAHWYQKFSFIEKYINFLISSWFFSFIISYLTYLEIGMKELKTPGVLIVANILFDGNIKG